MNREIISYTILFVIMVLVQALICNHIALFNVAVPMIFIYFIIRLPIGINQSLLYTLSFLLGFTIDLFSDTPGVNALACTLLAVMKRPAFYAYVQRDDRSEDTVPCLSSLGWAVYSKFLLTMVAGYCLMAFSIEFFSFADVKDVLIMAGSSSLLTFLLLLGIDSLIITKREKRL